MADAIATQPEPTTSTSTTTSSTETHTYKYSIAMSCSGCSRAVEKVLKKLDGIKSYDVNLSTQTAEIQVPDLQNPSYETVLEKIKKTGKTVKAGWVDGEPK